MRERLGLKIGAGELRSLASYGTFTTGGGFRKKMPQLKVVGNGEKKVFPPSQFDTSRGSGTALGAR